MMDEFSLRIAVWRCALFFSAILCVVNCRAGNPWDRARISFVADKDGFYAAGEKICFLIKLSGIVGEMPKGYAVCWERMGDDYGEQGEMSVQKGLMKFPLARPCKVTTSMSRPGFVRFKVSLVDEKGVSLHDGDGKLIDFEGGAGVEPEKIIGVDEPPDFDDFWMKRKRRLEGLPLKVIRTELPSEESSVRIWSVVVECAGARPMTGYLTVPANASGLRRYPAECTFDGYSMADVDVAPKRGAADRIGLHINAHGYELGREKAYYKEFYDSIRSGGKDYLFDGEVNKNPEWTYFVGMTYRVMRALQYVKSLPEWNGKDLWVSGGSQGGLQAIWAAALDEDVTKAEPSIPWCCDLGSRTKFSRLGGWRPGYVEALGYYDPVNHAKRISKKCRVLLRCGLGDYVCPPSGMCVLYNNLSCRKKIIWNQGQRHGGAPSPRIQEFCQESENWNRPD